MKIPFFRIDAFADRAFHGNPAGVCVLREWLPDETMQRIAAEAAAPASAFIVREAESYAIRWFTPKVEEEVCGHATLAAAFVVLTMIEPARDMVRFATRFVGPIGVTREGDLFAMDLPARKLEPVPAPPEALLAALGRSPREVLAAASYVAVYGAEAEVASLKPDLGLIASLDRPGVIVTAMGRESDIVCRYFAPAKGIPEDPATGAAHAQIVPFWAARLQKRALFSRQLSARGGALWCEDRGDHVRVAGRAVLYLKGEIAL
ncbi:MAG: PhzF family phenazine biosynthesis protein [Proteobacteria bacterium]|nr:PhzF family phenazine biosynthesis protein [Pseudomonadota bacterium]